ncbi:hypothetical protein [Agrococcus sp. Ld7]|uniref:hypothetical protein n=1 Tax=Agrococcus sp. Ld7 TaxID=649148 RepID=UPI0038640F88
MRTASHALAASLVVLGSLSLAGCGQPVAPAAPSTPATSPPAQPEPTASLTPEPTAAADGWHAFETQDGAMRMRLPDGWSVEDRSAMEASEMYNTGPRWLNDLIVLDQDGNAMLSYEEAYGDDSSVCAEWQPADIEVAVDPYSPSMRDAAQDAGMPPEVQVRSDIQQLLDWDGERDVPTGDWAVSLDMLAAVPSSAECEWDGWEAEVWAGSRLAMVRAIADEPADDGTGRQIVIRGEQEARAWFASDEAATLVDVLSTVQFTGAPLLDTAP